ncbi:MAG: HD domain-containing protein [Promethearchaeota archaeon]
MKNENFIKIIRDHIIVNSELDDIHGFPHIERVYNLCLILGNQLNANLKILKISTLLHDLGRKKEKDIRIKKGHAEISANLAKMYLTSQNFNITDEELENIIHCIKSHSFSNNIKPRTLEAKILSDADKLDAIGAIGLYRTIGYTIQKKGNLNDVIKHLEEKILKIKDLLFLDISKKIAEKRHKIIMNFYDEIKKEI